MNNIYIYIYIYIYINGRSLWVVAKLTKRIQSLSKKIVTTMIYWISNSRIEVYMDIGYV
jgi:hypothetical protein